jgi:hypothetical protein
VARDAKMEKHYLLVSSTEQEESLGERSASPTDPFQLNEHNSVTLTAFF